MQPIYFLSQFTTNRSKTLLRNGVSEIILRSSSLWGSSIFFIGVPYSIFQCLGHSAKPHFAELIMLLKTEQTGVAISGANSDTKRRGRSPGTPLFGLWAAFI